ncbi:MAG: mannose-6-phosphate isomerase, class I [Propionibacteriaceae bacterium]|jgi:mannose-6-phosphate isomerase|nr:mannose-6-phosphate isomerase, class I [Propionibacteriaceae bacterium]
MLHLTGQIRDYAWGSLTAIPELLGHRPTGEPQAEYWLGAHPLAPATVDGASLDQVLHDHPEWVGDRTYRAFGDRYPVLMKILAADHPLSLQAHPNREQAEEGYARENQAKIPLDAPHRIYRDTWPKPEILVALTEFDGLCGFRDPLLTVDLFRRLGVSESFDSVIGPLSKRKGPAAIAEVFLDILSQDHPDHVNEVLRLAPAAAEDESDLGLFARTALELGRYFPQQPSILAALMLNRLHLSPGQGLFLPTRTLHSYLGGVGIEVMACSDNVLRGGLTTKYINVDELISVVDFTPCVAAPVETVDDGGFTRYLTPTPEFALWRGELSSEPLAVPRTDSLRIALVVDGEAHLRHGDSGVDLLTGEAVLIPFGEDVWATGSATIFVTAPGV